MEPRDTSNSSGFREKVRHIPVAREGIPYIAAAAFITLILSILDYPVLALPSLLVTLFVAHFFRDPERISNAGDHDVLSPADGNVIALKRVDGSPFWERPCLKISIFMSIFDVHVNRIPGTGVVEAVKYKKGQYLAANLDRAGLENERNSLWIKMDSGHEFALSQVAGLIARRIVCWPKAGDSVLQGERFGMIRFGSRMDVYVPQESEILVSQGQHVFGGETILCRLK
jgi:phosphatidylserine decarboxylase